MAPITRNTPASNKPVRPGSTSSASSRPSTAPTDSQGTLLRQVRQDIAELRAEVDDANEKLNYFGPLLEALVQHLGVPNPHEED